jgi:copper chaperone
MMTTVKIKGMSCQHCAMAVTRALEEIEGVRDVTVDVDKGEAKFQEEKPVDMNVVEENIKQAGYRVVG